MILTLGSWLISLRLILKYCGYLLMTESLKLTLRSVHIEPAEIHELEFRFLFLWRFLPTNFCSDQECYQDWEPYQVGK